MCKAKEEHETVRGAGEALGSEGAGPRRNRRTASPRAPRGRGVAWRVTTNLRARPPVAAS